MGHLLEKELRLRAMSVEERSEHEKAARQWLEENREAIESSNRWIEENGIPYAEHRKF
jgi:post-segregation antitoxin (ccd killing protein)